MNYPRTLIITVLVCSTAAVGPEPVTCDSPCDCHNAHGEGRWLVKTDASLPTFALYLFRSVVSLGPIAQLAQSQPSRTNLLDHPEESRLKSGETERRSIERYADQR
jgi:hypothetical protein